MKRLILFFAMSCVFTANIQAQEVWKEVKRMSANDAKNNSKDIEIRKMATFKVDALDYMKQRYVETLPDSCVADLIYKLDHQAYALYDFVNKFMQQLDRFESKKDKQRVIDIFKQTSLENCKFFDTDKDVVESYIQTPGYLTQFSLDTDWEKAVEDIEKKIKEKAFNFN